MIVRTKKPPSSAGKSEQTHCSKPAGFAIGSDIGDGLPANTPTKSIIWCALSHHRPLISLIYKTILPERLWHEGCLAACAWGASG